MGIFKRLSIDLGTANTLISDLDSGIILHEPTTVAIDMDEKVIALGLEAEQLRGRCSNTVTVNRPLKDGVIFSQDAAELMLSHFMRQVLGSWSIFIPRVIAGVPSGASDVECRALRETISSAGAKLLYLIKEPVAAAIGAGLNVTEPVGNMVLDIGGGTSEVAILSMAGLILSASTKVAGNELTESIQRYLKQKYHMKIGFRIAEEIKHQIGSVCPNTDLNDQSLEVAGVDLITSLPIKHTLHGAEIQEVLMEPIQAILVMISQSLENLEPELAADLAHNGITMVGGGALLKGLDRLINETFHLPVNIAEDPIHCVALGASEALANPQKYRAFLRGVG